MTSHASNWATRATPSTQATRWLIVRHAQTLWNAAGRVQGQTDIPLSEVGLRQAQLLASYLESWDVDAAYSSDLSRTVETARRVLDARDVPLYTTPELREFGYGRWEGKTHPEIQEADPDLYAEFRQRREDFAPPGGESLRDVVDRIDMFVSRVKQDQVEGKTLLVVGHGGALRVLITRLLDLPASASWGFLMESAGLSVVDSHSQRSTLRLLNDTSFLPEELGPRLRDERRPDGRRGAG